MLLRLVGLLFVVIAVSPADIVSAEDLDCVPIEGLAPLLEPGRALLLGEIHGTAQSPAFVGNAACHALDKSLGVTVALELPQSDQPLMHAFFSSDGGSAARTAFLKSSFWKRAYQDGRATQAVFSLVQDLRRLHQAGHPVRVLLLDRPEVFRERDQFMAARLLVAIKASPKDVVISLTGNLHNRTTPGSNRMGSLVAEAMPAGKLLSLNVSHQGGAAWICTGSSPADCKSQKLGGRGTVSEPRITLWEKVSDQGYHGTYDVGKITSSPPESTQDHPYLPK